MRQKVEGPTGLRWTVKRLIVPTGFRPLTRTDMLHAAIPGRTVVDGMARQVPDAVGGWTGPLPLAFLLFPLVLPLVPVALLLRRLRVLPWTIEARAYPWGRRYPPIVLTYAVRGDVETRTAFRQLLEALARGDGAPVIAGTEKLSQTRNPHSHVPVVGTSGPRQVEK
jgi:hypothetical protein